MSTSDAFSYLLTWSLSGCVLFSLFVLIAFRTGLVYTARKEDGTLKNRIPLKGILAMTIIPLGLFGLYLVSNYFGWAQKGIPLDFGSLFLLNYGVYVILFVYDTLIIDGLVISTWRPTFLKIPATMGKESMKKHILISLPIGLLIGAILTLVGTGLSYLLWMKTN